MAIIREYSPLDYPQVRLNLEEAGIFYENRDSKDNYDELAESESGIVLVADDDGEIAGNIVGQQFGINLAMLWSLAVAKRFRRRGIATDLTSTMEHQLSTRGVTEVWGFVDVTNHISQRMLKKAGFETNYNHKYFGPWKKL